MYYNKVTLLGRVGADPEIRYTQNGTKVAKFSLATNKYRKSSNGERQQETQWHSIIFFGYSANTIENILNKGDLALVEGEITYNKYTDKTGQTKYKTEIVGQVIEKIYINKNEDIEQTTQKEKETQNKEKVAVAAAAAEEEEEEEEEEIKVPESDNIDDYRKTDNDNEDLDSGVPF